MTATESPEQLAQNLRPVMDYFEALKTKYPGSDKGKVKMRYSAFYNLAALHYFLDQPDEVAKQAEDLIKNGYDTGDGISWRTAAKFGEAPDGQPSHETLSGFRARQDYIHPVIRYL